MHPTTAALAEDRTSWERSRLSSQEKAHTERATARQIRLPTTNVPPTSGGTTVSELSTWIVPMHQRSLGTAQMVRWDRSRRPLDNSTLATSFLLLPARSAKSIMRTLASSSQTLHASLPRQTLESRCHHYIASHSRKGGAFPIMQSQFRRALGCLIARGQAQHLLKWRHYARPSAREAYQTAEDNHSK